MMAQTLTKDRSFAIVGLGKTGLSCARFLAARGHRFAGFDADAGAAGVEAFRRTWPDAPLFTGPFQPAELARYSDMLISPGISVEQPPLVVAAADGVRAGSDIELFCAAASAPILAITGSNGKSTVTALVGRMAERAGLAVGVGGNIGTPALDLLADDRFELFVLELSSFQLERIEQVGARVAAVLNISPDHLDRHADIAAYRRAKLRIFRGCDVAVCNRDDELTQPLSGSATQAVTFGLSAPAAGAFGLIADGGRDYLARGDEHLLAVDRLRLPGRHNVANALAALAIGDAAGLPIPVMLDALGSFTGLAHRCQPVAEIGGVRYIDDSKGTNVGATVAAVTGLSRGGADIVLIAGGVGKGQDFAPLAAVVPLVRTWVLIGEAASMIVAAIGDTARYSFAVTMTDAVAAAREQAAPGDTVLLSPACASFDQFADYVDRGRQFAAAVRALGEDA